MKALNGTWQQWLNAKNSVPQQTTQYLCNNQQFNFRKNTKLITLSKHY